MTAADNPWTRAAFRRVNPTFSAAKFAAGPAFKDADKRRLFDDHLVLAGLPE